MKKTSLFSAAMVTAMMFIATAVWAFDAPAGAGYGVTSDGIYYVSNDVVKAANGSAPKVMYDAGGTEWVSVPMKLDGNYYIYNSGKKPKFSTLTTTDFCFDVGGKYIPHALLGDARFKAGEVVDNGGRGGYNFRVPLK